MKKLTKHQRLVLAAAAARDQLRIDPLPDEVGADGTKIVDALLKAGLVIAGKTGLMLSMTGFDALRIEPNAHQLAILDETRAEGDEGGGEPKKRETKRVRRSRRPASRKRGLYPPIGRLRTKQAKLVAMLRRPAGATIEQIARALDWQPHTVRGVITGAVKQKLGLTVTSEKSAAGARVYRIR
jgi:hypothetical protein